MISLLLPTRGRPDNLIRFYESAKATARDPFQVVVYIDNDDDSYANVDLPIECAHGPRIVLSEAWNECAKAARGSIFGHMGDDIIFRTDHWDVLIEDTFSRYPDGIAFVHGRDGNESNRLYTFGTHGFIHRNWVDTVGYFVPPYFSSDYNDTWLNDVANMINRHVYIPDIYTEHMHPAFGKAEMDQTHLDRIDRSAVDRPGDLYYSKAMMRKRLDDARMLIEVMA